MKKDFLENKIKVMAIKTMTDGQLVDFVSFSKEDEKVKDAALKEIKRRIANGNTIVDQKLIDTRAKYLLKIECDMRLRYSSIQKFKEYARQSGKEDNATNLENFLYLPEDLQNSFKVSYGNQQKVEEQIERELRSLINQQKIKIKKVSRKDMETENITTE